MIVFYRVFDRYNVAVEVFVYIVYHARQSRRLAASCGARNQEQPAGPPAQGGTNLWQAYFLKRHDLRWDKTQNNRNITLLAKNSHAESGLIAVSKTKIGPALFLKFLLIALGRYAFHQSDRIVGFEHFRFQRPEPAVYS
jgi:hypothetical protein